MGDLISLRDLSNEITPRLVSAKHWGDATFINLPMLYPSGAFVTVRISYVRDGLRVSDSGYAYREADSFGAGRSFTKTAHAIANDHDVNVGKRSIYVDVRPNEVERAIFDISAASFTIAERIVARASSGAEVNMSDALKSKLDNLFPQSVGYDEKIIGASSTEWEVSAVAKFNGSSAVFQTVSNYPVAVYKASTAFHDLAALDNPPNLISVVNSKEEMGRNISLLSQAGRVIEIGQADEVFMKASH